MDNYPPGFDPTILDTPEPMSETEMTEYIEDHMQALQEYHADHCAEGVLDDDMPDAFDSWVVDLSEEDLIKIVNK